MGQPILILREVNAKLLLDSLPLYREIKTVDGEEKEVETRNLVAGLQFNIIADVMNKGDGLPDISDSPDLDISSPYFWYNSWPYGEHVLSSTFAGGYFNPSYINLVSVMLGCIYYYAAETVPGPIDPSTGLPDPIGNTETLKSYSPPPLNIGSGSHEGRDCLQVPNHEWRIRDVYTVDNPETGKKIRKVIFTGSHDYLREQTEIEVELE